jgi:hypothetical protein
MCKAYLFRNGSDTNWVAGVNIKLKKPPWKGRPGNDCLRAYVAKFKNVNL